MIIYIYKLKLFILYLYKRSRIKIINKYFLLTFHFILFHHFRCSGGLSVHRNFWSDSSSEFFSGRDSGHELQLRGQDHRRLLCRPRGRLSALSRLRSSLRIGGKTLFTSKTHFDVIPVVLFLKQKSCGHVGTIMVMTGDSLPRGRWFESCNWRDH